MWPAQRQHGRCPLLPLLNHSSARAFSTDSTLHAESSRRLLPRVQVEHLPRRDPPSTPLHAFCSVTGRTRRQRYHEPFKGYESEAPALKRRRREDQRVSHPACAPRRRAVIVSRLARRAKRWQGVVASAQSPCAPRSAGSPWALQSAAGEFASITTWLSSCRSARSTSSNSLLVDAPRSICMLCVSRPPSCGGS